jgi:hypothetical protein
MRLDDATEAQVTFDFRDPACQSPRIRQGVPEVVCIRVEDALHAYGSATIVDGAQGTGHATDLQCV